MAKHTLKSTLMYVAIMVAALILCLDDIEGWPADWNENCSDMIRISDLVETRFGNTQVQISVNVDSPGFGGDMSCVNFWWCINKLFDLYPRVVRVEIMNDLEDFVPTRWNSVDLCHARLMNEPWEEYGTAVDEEDFLASCYGDFDNLSYRND
jgi:hypothetical protein